MPDFASLIDGEDLKEALFNDDAFEALIATWGLDEVKISCARLATEIHHKLRSSDRDYNRSGARLIKVNLDARLSILKKRIADRNREENHSELAMEKKWGQFTEAIARELYLVAPDALRAQEAPNGADGVEWLLNRVEWKARKEANNA